MSHEETHSHGHHDHGGKADIWTKLAAINEGAQGLMGAYPLAKVFGSVTRLKPWRFGLSPISMAFGGAFSIFATAGAAYCHKLLNTQNQDLEQKALISPEHNFLSWKEKVALIADAISHTLENAGLPITIAALLLSAEVVDVPAWAEILLNLGLLTWGGVSAVADMRTCRNSLLKSHG